MNKCGGRLVFASRRPSFTPLGSSGEPFDVAYTSSSSSDEEDEAEEEAEESDDAIPKCQHEGGAAGFGARLAVGGCEGATASCQSSELLLS